MRIGKRLTALVASFLVILAALALLGSSMTPDWNVREYHDHIRVDERKTAIASDLGPTTPEGTYKVKETFLKVNLAPGVSVNAIVRQPQGAKGPRPACLFIHGAGTGKASEVYGDLASAMASAGITTLVADKRLDTYSALHRDYGAMARDYDRSFEVLKAWPGVDPGRVGIYAESEGTWISSIMTARHRDIAFSIMTSPPVYPGRQQMPMAATSYLDLIHAPAGIRGVIPKLLGMDLSVLGLEYADFKALPYLDHLSQPTLVNYGTNDVSMPVEQGAREILKRTEAAGNRNVTLRYYPTNHQIRTGSRLAKDGLPLESHYTHDLENWINGVSEGTGADQWSTHMIAGSQPNQRFTAPTRTDPGLLRSLRALLILMIGGPLLLLLSLLAAAGLGLGAWIRGRGRRRNPVDPEDRSIGFARGLTPRLWGLGAGSLALMGLLVWYAVRIVRHALTLEPLSSLEIASWGLLKFLSVLLALDLALVIVRLLTGSSARRNHNDSNMSRNQVRLAGGWGHWVVLTLTITGSLMVLGTLAFWGLFSL